MWPPKGKYARLFVIMSPAESDMIRLVAFRRRVSISRLIRECVMPVVRRATKCRARLEAKARGTL